MVPRQYLLLTHKILNIIMLTEYVYEFACIHLSVYYHVLPMYYVREVHIKQFLSFVFQSRRENV